MSVFGKVEAFDPESENWNRYVDRLEFYFEANEVTEAKTKRAILLSVCGSTLYGIIMDLIAPSKPTDVDYKNLVKRVGEHFNPKPNEIVERFKFHSCTKAQGEAVSSYVVKLKHQATHCGFGATLEERLRDQFVWGVGCEQIQRRLLAIPDLTWQSALDKAIALEAADKGAQTLQPTAQVNQVENPGVSSQKRQSTRSVICYRCGDGHTADSCRFKEAVCHYCKKVGHIARVCRRRKQDKDRSTHRQDPKAAHLMSESTPPQDSEEEEEQADYLMALKEKPHGPIVATVELNNFPVQFEVDTGASRTVIGEDCFNKIQAAAPGLALRPSEVVLRSFTGEKVEVKGKTTVNVNYEGQTAALEMLVVRNRGPNLLGRDWMGVLRLNWKELFKTIFKLSDSQLQNVLSKHKEIFKDELGTLKGTEVRFHVDTSVKPRYCKARPVLFAMRPKIEAELDYKL